MRLNRTIRYLLLFCCLSLSFPAGGASTEDWFQQGVAHLTANRLDSAIESFNRSLELIPHDYEAYNNRGIAYSRKGETSQAEIDFSKALELSPKFYNAYINRGIARQKQGIYASALLDYLEAHKFKPENRRPQLLMAWILVTCPDSRLRNGALSLRIALTISAGQASTKLLPLLAAAHAAAGDFESAITLQKENLSRLHTKRADANKVELQQGHLARYQSGRPLQDATPSSQNLSDNDAKSIMAQVNSALKRSLPTKTVPIRLAKTKPIPDNKIPRKKTPPGLAKNLPQKPPPAPPDKSRGSVQLSSLKRAAKAIPASNSPYVLVIGSFRSDERGFPVADKLRQKGHPVFTSWVVGQTGEKWYQIYYGWYPDKTSADAAAALLIEKRFHSVLVRQAPFTLQIQSETTNAALQNVKQRLDQINLISYQIGRRLMIGAYKEKRMTEIVMTDVLSAAGLSYQLIKR